MLLYVEQIIVRRFNSNYTSCCLSQKKNLSTKSFWNGNYRYYLKSNNCWIKENKKNKYCSLPFWWFSPWAWPEHRAVGKPDELSDWAADSPGKTPRLCWKPQNTSAFYWKSERSFWETPCYEHAAKQRLQQNMLASILLLIEVKSSFV